MKSYIILFLVISSIINSKNILVEEDYETTETRPDLQDLRHLIEEPNLIPEDPQFEHSLFESELSMSTINGKNRVLMNLIANANGVDEHTRMLRANQPGDKAEVFFKNDKFEKDIYKLPTEKQLSKTPWTGYYWAIRYGILSARYNDQNEQNSIFQVDQSGNRNYLTWKQSIEKFPQPQDYNNAVSKAQDMHKYHEILSASEKYDSLLGDTTKWTLTNRMKQRGRTVAKTQEGDIETWMGICHGWAIASYLEPKPLRPVTVKNQQGVSITFNIHDIMALASLYWANARYVSNFIGHRCGYADFSKIPSDEETQIWTDYKCFGINPGDFHLVFANHIGINDKSFIFEPKVDNQIWNHPVKGYNIIYYHPVTRFIGTIDESKISVEDAKKVTDIPFLNFVIKNMNPETEFLLPAKITVDYVIENEPTTKNTPYQEEVRQVDYLYYLEICKNNKICGGEWRFNNHPNYIYGPREGDEVLYSEDRIIRTYTGKPEELKRMLIYANIASARFAPLRAIVKYLIQESSKPLP